MKKYQIEHDKFESFIKSYPALLKLSDEVNKLPGDLVNVLVETGAAVLEQSQNVLIETATVKVKEVITKNKFYFSDQSLNTLSDLLDFLKSKNQVKK